ncbi:MAG: hypothetical protein ACYTXC_27740 [Nostoc sp.]
MRAIAQRLEEYGDFRVRRLPETIQGEQRRVTSDGLVSVILVGKMQDGTSKANYWVW